MEESNRVLGMTLRDQVEKCQFRTYIWATYTLLAYVMGMANPTFE